LATHCAAYGLDLAEVRARIAEAKRADEQRQRARLAEAVRRDDLAGNADLPPFAGEGVSA
jgi:hypothetical protein